MKSQSNEAINPAADAVASQAAKSVYHLGATTVYSHTADSRFAYTLYVPASIEDPERPVDLVVSLHGSTRAMEIYRNGFAEFGRWNDCVILSPLFPVGVLGDGNGDGYKQLVEGDIRYDQVLLDMVASVGQKYNRRFDTFALFGYSGGGQFSHRFCYLHPEKLWAASIGARGFMWRKRWVSTSMSCGVTRSALLMKMRSAKPVWRSSRRSIAWKRNFSALKANYVIRSERQRKALLDRPLPPQKYRSKLIVWK